MSRSAAVALQVVNYRTRSYLERCLQTAARDLRESSLRYELNVLDNDPQESIEDVVRAHPAGRLFESARNIGFGRGHNLLAGETHAPYLLILNPDVEFAFPHTVSRLLDVVAGATTVKVAGPKLLAPDGSAQVYDHARLHGLRAQIALRGGNSYWRQTEVRQRVAWVSGAAMLVEREAFLSVGGFDESFFLYKEDEDLCLRLRRGGALVIYEPAAKLVHHGSVIARRKEELAIATSHYVEKHFPHRRVAGAFSAAHRGLGYLRL